MVILNFHTLYICLLKVLISAYNYKEMKQLMYDIDAYEIDNVAMCRKQPDFLTFLMKISQ